MQAQKVKQTWRQKALIKTAQQSARTYADDKGPRLNVSAIVVRFDIPPDTVYNRQRKGWPGLGGKPLKSVPEPLGFFGRTEHTFYETDVEAALKTFLAGDDPKLLGWVDAFTYRDAKGEWVTLKGIGKQFPSFPEKSATNWAIRFPCRFLTNEDGKRRKLASQFVRPAIRRNRQEIRVYLKSDLETILRCRAGVKAEVRHTDVNDRTWLQTNDIAAELGVSPDFCGYWCRRESRVRNGKALRSIRIPNTKNHRGSPGETLVFSLDDARDIVAGRESRSPGMGRGATARHHRELNKQRAMEFLSRILADGKGMSSANVMAKAAEAGISRGQIYIAKEVCVRAERKNGNYQWRLRPTANGYRAKTPIVATNGHTGPPSKSGRKIDQITQEVYDYCYDLRKQKVKGLSIMMKAKKQYGAKAPQSEAAVYIYAKRSRKNGSKTSLKST